jgi:circadian clock protein KaiC
MVFEIRREKIGITEIDSMIQGGLPNNSITGILGPPGVGKSIFSLHFTLEGARKGQKSIYINLEEPRRNIDNMIRQFKFGEEFIEFEKKGLIIIKCFDYNQYEKIHEDLFDRIQKDRSIKRLVIDSFNCFFASSYEFESKVDMAIKKMIVEVFYKLRQTKLTTLLTLENGSESNFNIPYLVDGMINLDYLDLGTIERRISIPKMRWTNQNKEGRAYEISSDGIKVSEDSWVEQ